MHQAKREVLLFISLEDKNFKCFNFCASFWNLLALASQSTYLWQGDFSFHVFYNWTFLKKKMQ